MKTEEFEFSLPPGLIAQNPHALRDASRMMILRRTDRTIEHGRFAGITAFLRPGDLLVVNNTKVIPARVIGRKPTTDGKVELFFLEEAGPGEWEILLRARRRPKPGDSVLIGDDGASAVMLADGTGGRARIRLAGRFSAQEIMERHGSPPLPPYIRRPDSARDGNESSDQKITDDRERYQTVYARHAGAVAAPTAGLHFTPELLAALEQRGIRCAEITLHVGIGTFRPVTAENAEDHVMESERYEISESAARLISETRASGGRVIAVGSTSVRTLEHAAAADGIVRAGSGRTAIFIRPPFTFRVVDAILTNFHLPRSTLLMMMSAFAGREFLLRAYAGAVRERYRFFSYGDCMLIV